MAADNSIFARSSGDKIAKGATLARVEVELVGGRKATMSTSLGDNNCRPTSALRDISSCFHRSTSACCNSIRATSL